MGKVIHGYNGMTKDLSKVKFPKGYYFEGKNIRITATSDQSKGDVTNEGGNELLLSLPDITIIATEGLPSTLFATLESGAYVQLTWTREYNEDLTYIIERKWIVTTSPGNEIVAQTVEFTHSDPELKYIDYDTGENRTYEYKITTVRGNQIIESEPVRISTSFEVIQPPSGLTASFDNEGVITLKWSDSNSEINTHDVRITNWTLDDLGEYTSVFNITDASTEVDSSGRYNFKDNKLVEGVHFIGDEVEYKVRTKTKLNNITEYSNPVTIFLDLEINIDPVGETFVGSIGEESGESGILIEWSDDISTHQFYRDSDGSVKILAYQIMKLIEVDEEQGNVPDEAVDGFYYSRIGDEFYYSSANSDVSFSYLDTDTTPGAIYTYKLDIYTDALTSDQSLLMNQGPIDVEYTQSSST